MGGSGRSGDAQGTAPGPIAGLGSRPHPVSDGMYGGRSWVGERRRRFDVVPDPRDCRGLPRA